LHIAFLFLHFGLDEVSFTVADKVIDKENGNGILCIFLRFGLKGPRAFVGEGFNALKERDTKKFSY
jgi:hypothetical protein